MNLKCDSWMKGWNIYLGVTLDYGSSFGAHLNESTENAFLKRMSDSTLMFAVWLSLLISSIHRKSVRSLSTHILNHWLTCNTWQEYLTRNYTSSGHFITKNVKLMTGQEKMGFEKWTCVCHFVPGIIVRNLYLTMELKNGILLIFRLNCRTTWSSSLSITEFWSSISMSAL